MKFYTKTKTHTHIIHNVLGIKFKIKRKINKKTFKIYNFIESSWSANGATDELIFYLEELKWLHPDLYIPSMDLIYISCLYEKGPEDFAIVALKEHVEQYGITNIEDFLPVAFLANKIGIENERIQKAAYIFENMEKLIKEKTFEKYLKDKSVAIVGNSPREIGLKKGQMIDSYDAVVRMNMFSVSDEFKEDYGEKTSICVNNSNIEMFESGKIFSVVDYEWVIIPYDFWHLRISSFMERGQFIDFYYDAVKLQKAKIIYFKSEYALSLKQEKSFALPSSGLITLWIIYKSKGELFKEDIYGMTDELKNPNDPYDYYYEKNLTNFGIYEQTKLYSTYFKDRRTIEHWHNMNEEIKFYKNFISEKKSHLIKC